MPKSLNIPVRSAGGLFLIVAVVAGLLAAFLVYQAVSRAASTIPVVVSAREIAPGEEIQAQDLTTVQLPAVGVNSDAVRDAEEVVGGHARTLILKASVIRPGMVAELSGEGGTLPARLAPGNRAFTLPLSLFGGGVPAAGDSVDLIAVLDAPGAVETKEPARAAVIVRGAKVLDVSRPEDADAQDGYFTVELTPKEVELVSLAMSYAKVSAALRGLEPEEPQPGGSSLAEIWAAGAPRP